MSLEIVAVDQVRLTLFSSIIKCIVLCIYIM